MVREAVDRALEAFAERHDVRVVAARDVGSRAWGLADRDSDHDVQLVFVQRPVEYATLSGYESSLDLSAGELENEFAAGPDTDTDLASEPEVECHGWNVRRFAELLVDSNPTAFEFLHSPLRYREFEPLERLERDVGDSFAPMALYHHYRSLAIRQYRKYLQGRLLDSTGDLAYRVLEERDDEYLVQPAGDDANGGEGEAGSANSDDDDDPARTIPKSDFEGCESAYDVAATDRTVKRHLYVARGVLYAGYVRETHEFPTLEFPRFLDDIRDAEWIDPDVLERTHDLVDRKRRGEGDAVVGRLFEPEEVLLPEIDPSAHAGRTVDRDRVDEFVRESLEAAFETPLDRSGR